ncbi:hypothetical protein [Streptomyces sp. NPDC001401]|uniref:hypothetical protein n=1 Tax=Streptomyces sp. NPDC001401 TaxID=3364570 RepID=UPI003683863C
MSGPADSGAFVTMVLGTGAFSSKTLLSVALLRHLSNQGVDAVPYKAMTVLRDRDLEHSSLLGSGLPYHLLAARVAADPRQSPVVVRHNGLRRGDLYVHGERLGEVAIPCKDAVDLGSLPLGARDHVIDAAHTALDHLTAAHRHVVVEGAGSAVALPPEDDLPNIGIVRRIRPAIVLVSEFSGGGAAAALIGTSLCLPPDVRGMIRGYVVANTGDSAVVRRTTEMVTRASGMRCLGTVPADDGLGYDELYTDTAIEGWAARLKHHVDVEALLASPDVGVPSAG